MQKSIQHPAIRPEFAALVARLTHLNAEMERIDLASNQGNDNSPMLRALHEHDDIAGAIVSLTPESPAEVLVQATIMAGSVDQDDEDTRLASVYGRATDQVVRYLEKAAGITIADLGLAHVYRTLAERSAISADQRAADRVPSPGQSRGRASPAQASKPRRQSRPRTVARR